MNWADITIACIILISVLISVFRGFVREVLSLLAWVAAFWVASTFGASASVLLEPYIVLAFIGVLILTLMAAGLVNHLISQFMEKTGLSGTDRMLGALFGLARGAAIVIIAVLAAGLTTIPGEAWWQTSQLLAPFETAALYVLNWIPPDLAKYFSF